MPSCAAALAPLCFIGFPEIRRLEEEFLPSADVLAKYEGSVGFQP